MYAYVKMVKPGYPTIQTRYVKIEVVVHNNVEVTELRRSGYQIANIEVKDS